MIYCIWDTLQIKLNLEKRTLISSHIVIHLNIRFDLNNANLNNTAKGENNVFQNLKKSTRKDDVVLHFFLFISMSGLIDDSWILTSASVLSLLEYVVLVEGNKSSLTQLCG